MVGCHTVVLVAMQLVQQYWSYVGSKKYCVGCVLVVCVGRVLVGPILVVTYDQNAGFGGRALVVRVLRPYYNQFVWKNARES